MVFFFFFVTPFINQIFFYVTPVFYSTMKRIEHTMVRSGCEINIRSLVYFRRHNTRITTTITTAGPDFFPFFFVFFRELYRQGLNDYGTRFCIYL